MKNEKDMKSSKGTSETIKPWSVRVTDYSTGTWAVVDLGKGWRPTEEGLPKTNQGQIKKGINFTGKM